jgi:hypothetical protein
LIDIGISEILDYFAIASPKSIAISLQEDFAIAENLLLNHIPVIAYASDISESMIKPEYRKDFLVDKTSVNLASVLQKIVDGNHIFDAAEIQMSRSIETWNQLFSNYQNRAESCKGLAMILEEKPLVSIVIVHHNRPHYLKQAIESIESQTYGRSKLEVILVDDGSNEPEAVQLVNDLSWTWWENKGWKVVREPQRWLGAARNTGARHASGKFIVFLDDDDLMKPQKVSFTDSNCRL